jgi:hypothetical protein
MKRIGKGRQAVADQEEEEPRQDKSQSPLPDIGEPSPKINPRGRIAGLALPEARGANHLVVMLGDALAAEEPQARRAPRRRLALRVIETTLMCQRVHGPVEFRK